MKTILRIIAIPVFVVGLILSFIPFFFILASVSIGAWCEDILRRLGYRARPSWLPMALGIAGYAGLGVAGPAYAGRLLIGWPGAIIAPLLTLVAIAILGRW